MTIGRNAPCPCGSGKKYKKCCIAKASVTTAVDLDYHRYSKVFETLVDRLYKVARQAFGDACFEAALSEFWGWPEEDEPRPDGEKMERMASLFSPWFLFCWHYDPDKSDAPLEGPEKTTVAELYVRKRGDALEGIEGKIIAAFGRKPHSFYEVLGLKAGRSVDLMDVLTGETITVQERAGSTHLSPSDIIFGRAVMVDGVGMFAALGATIIPPRVKIDLIALRKKMRKGRDILTDEDLYEWGLELRKFYLDVDQRLHQPPQLANTDGDPMEYHELHFEIDSAEDAFDRLASLCVSDTKSALRKSAAIDPRGQIETVEFSWDRKGFKGQPGLQNTLLGRIHIEGRQMTIAVNSARRAEEIRRLVARLLGKRARFKLDAIQDIESIAAAHSGPDAPPAGGPSPEELMNHPQVQAQLRSIMARHWESWPDEKLPALGGRTPRKAVGTADGREAVLALLADFERPPGGDEIMAALNRDGIRRVREILGL